MQANHLDPKNLVVRLREGAAAIAIASALVGCASTPDTAAKPVVVGTVAMSGTPSTLAKAVQFEDKTRLVRPEGYREWIYIGTPLTPDDMNDGKAGFPEFHSVYIHPEAYAAFGATGKFPEGTVIIKELVTVGSKAATSGNGYFMGEFVGLEAMVKDKSRFADAAGGWSFFSFGHSYPLSAKEHPKSAGECSACHQANAATDQVYTQYYPVLRAVRN